MRRLHLLGVVAYAALLTSVPATAQDRLLFVGNSYTFYSGGLQTMVESLLEEATGADVYTQAVTAGGYRLPQHLADADGTNGDRPLRQALVTGADTEWDLVVLQDQSQIPAFPMGQAEWIASRDAAAGLDDLIAPTGAHTMFFLTWGRRDGDSMNPGRFPDFRTMQGLLTEGYVAFRDATSTEVRPTFVAPVGPAFELVYDDVIADGGTPESSGSSFHRLYAGDGSHPSDEGTYLAAAVFAAAYAGIELDGLDWAPGGIDADRRDYLLAVAAEAVFDATADWAYPWTGADREDVGTPDVGEPDVGEPDTGGGDVGEPDVDETDAGEPDAGQTDATESDAGDVDSGAPDVDVDSGDDTTPADTGNGGTSDDAQVSPPDRPSATPDGGGGGCATSRVGRLPLFALVLVVVGARRPMRRTMEV